MKVESFKRVLAIVKKAQEDRLLCKIGPAEVFDYDTWFTTSIPHETVGEIVEHPCGTAGCIAGWGMILHTLDRNGPKYSRYNLDFSHTYATEFFDIPYEEGDYLFYGEWHFLRTRAPIEDVIAKLENIIETGEVINPVFDAPYLEVHYDSN